MANFPDLNKDDYIEDSNKKNGFYLAYLFQKNEIKRKSIPKSIRDKLWNDEYKDSLSGRCFTCNKELDYHTFHASHIISVKNVRIYQRSVRQHKSPARSIAAADK